MPIGSGEERPETGRPHLTAADKVRASRQRTILPALLLSASSPTTTEADAWVSFRQKELRNSLLLPRKRFFLFYLCLESFCVCTFEVCLHAMPVDTN